jgi:hypothetical protein
MRHLVRRLIQVALLVGLLAMFSYATGLHNVVRMKAPAAGAWWNAHEFYLMEGAATAFGLLVALLIGLRLVAGTERLCRLAAIMLAFEAALLIPLTHLCARVARIGADGGAIVAPNRMAAYAGFESAKMLDKLLIAALYFFKTVAFGFLIGLAAFGAVMVGAIMTAHGDGASVDAPEIGPSSANQPGTCHDPAMTRS